MDRETTVGDEVRAGARSWIKVGACWPHQVVWLLYLVRLETKAGKVSHFLKSQPCYFIELRQLRDNNLLEISENTIGIIKVKGYGCSE